MNENKEMFFSTTKDPQTHDRVCEEISLIWQNNQFSVADVLLSCTMLSLSSLFACRASSEQLERYIENLKDSWVFLNKISRPDDTKPKP